MGRIVKITEYIGIVFVGTLAIITGIDVVGRYFFNSPLRGCMEISELLLACLVGLAMVGVTAEDGHIIVDTIFVRFRHGIQRILLVIASFVGAVLFGILTWQSAVLGLESSKLSRITDVLKIPVFPSIFIFALGCFLTFAVLTSQIIRLLLGNKR